MRGGVDLIGGQEGGREPQTSRSHIFEGFHAGPRCNLQDEALKMLREMRLQRKEVKVLVETEDKWTPEKGASQR